jgi:hypothetical protein
MEELYDWKQMFLAWIVRVNFVPQMCAAEWLENPTEVRNAGREDI